MCHGGADDLSFFEIGVSGTFAVLSWDVDVLIVVDVVASGEASTVVWVNVVDGGVNVVGIVTFVDVAAVVVRFKPGELLEIVVDMAPAEVSF